MVVDIGDGTVDGAPVIVPLVRECDPSAKQSRVAASGKAYLRGYDGDFQLSHLKEQAFIAARRPPMFDGALVVEALATGIPLVTEAVREAGLRSLPRGAASITDRVEPAAGGPALNWVVRAQPALPIT